MAEINMARKKLIIGIVVLIAAVLIAKEIIDYLPYFIGGAPLPVFGISNFDTKNHSVKVQIFDSNNISLFDKTYELGDSRSEQFTAQYPEKGWKDVHEKERLFPKGLYIFIVTMDNNFIMTQQIQMDDDRLASISIDQKGNLEISNPIS